MPPAIIAAAIGGAAALGSAAIGSHAAGKAADAQTDAAKSANALQLQIYNQNRTDQTPWREAGASAIGQLSEFLKPGADLTALLQAQPGYQAGLGQGVEAIDRSASARGSLDSGGQQKALTRYGQDYASQGLDKIFNRYAQVAGIGQNANNQLAQSGQNYANQSGQNLLSAGQATATGYQNQAGIATGAIGQLTGLGLNAFNQFGGGYSPAPQPVSAYGFGAGQPVAANYPTNIPGLIPTGAFGGF